MAGVLQRVCPICQSRGTYLRSQFDDRYGFPGEFPLIQCPKCEHKFLAAEFTPEQIENLYTRYYPRKDVDPCSRVLPSVSSAWVAWLEGERRSAFRWVEPGTQVLDIGCGTCESLLYHLSRGCEAHGVEADRNIAPMAAHLKLNVICGVFDPTNYAADYFDYVTMDQVIEHFPDPVRVLAQIRQILKPGGRIIVSTPNGRGWGTLLFRRRWLHWHAPYHLHYFSRKSIELAADKAGLGVIRCATIASSDWLLMQWAHLLRYPSPGIPSTYWIDVLRTGTLDSLPMLAIGAMHRMKINHLITRLMDLARIGDNHLVILRKPID